MTTEEFDAKIDALLAKLSVSALLREGLRDAPTIQKGPLRPSKVLGRQLGLAVTRSGIATFNYLHGGQLADVHMGVTVSLFVKGVEPEEQLEAVSNRFAANAYRALAQVKGDAEWTVLLVNGSSIAERTETEQLQTREDIECTVRWTTTIPQPEPEPEP